MAFDPTRQVGSPKADVHQTDGHGQVPERELQTRPRQASIVRGGKRLGHLDKVGRDLQGMTTTGWACRLGGRVAREKSIIQKREPEPREKQQKDDD
jgi:hypothetical protein